MKSNEDLRGLIKRSKGEDERSKGEDKEQKATKEGPKKGGEERATASPKISQIWGDDSF